MTANASNQAGIWQERGYAFMATPRGSYPSPGRMEPKRRTASGSKNWDPYFLVRRTGFFAVVAKTHRSPNTHKRYA